MLYSSQNFYHLNSFFQFYFNLTLNLILLEENIDNLKPFVIIQVQSKDFSLQSIYLNESSIHQYFCASIDCQPLMIYNINQIIDFFAFLFTFYGDSNPVCFS
jgi:hypothetical protein